MNRAENIRTVLEGALQVAPALYIVDHQFLMKVLQVKSAVVAVLFKLVLEDWMPDQRKAFMCGGLVCS
jgi:hypothetical protein